jgi:hypothetical protein
MTHSFERDERIACVECENTKPVPAGVAPQKAGLPEGFPFAARSAGKN